MEVLSDRLPLDRQHEPIVIPRGYRPEIDGLRAIAVLSVVSFHAGLPGFAGGFAGVDVFFVISGYLMASLVGTELESGGFGLRDFYERRIRRIFPALFAMLAASTVIALILFPPAELIYFARSLKAAALFVSNVQFAKEAGYFDIESSIKPLLHTWSLAVEEQFYIVFPIAMILVHRFAPSRIVPIMLAAMLFSLAAGVVETGRDPTVAFYLAQYRVWELLFGALLAFNAFPALRKPWTCNLLGAFGLVLIAAVVFRGDTAFPELSALIACTGTALVIHTSARGGFAARVLSSGPMVFIGLMSYSIYLWHWPMIVFTRYFFGHDLSRMQGVSIVILSIGVAYVSWRYIELPFRSRAIQVSRGRLFACASSVVCLAAATGAFVLVGNGLPERLPAAARAVYAAAFDKGRFYEAGCFTVSDHNGPSVSDIKDGRLCAMGASGASPQFLVWGDSHAAAMAAAIDTAAAEQGIHGLFAGHASCPPAGDVTLSGANDTRRCKGFNRPCGSLWRGSIYRWFS